MAKPATGALAERLARALFLVLDGGLATQLERRGCDLDDPLWSAKILLEAPAQIEAVHRGFADAGADIISTASYQATIPGLVARGVSELEARELLRGTVELARRAAPEALIAASIGSYGAYLADGSEYRGDYSLGRVELAAFHRERVELLADAGPDLLAFETIPSGVEAEAIAGLLRERGGPPAWVSFSLREAREPTLSDGTPLREGLLPLLAHPRIAAVGVNCLGPGAALPALELLAAHAPGVPLVVYPNSGEGWRDRAWIGSKTDPEGFARHALTWIAAGARVIGGCCRTGPEHVAALAGLRNPRFTPSGPSRLG